MRIFLSHPPAARTDYFGEQALAGLRELADVALNSRDRVLSGVEMIEAARGCAIIIADRQTPGGAAVFAGLPDLVAFQRVAVDIRNIDVDAASRHGVLVTRASPGFAAAVAEWIVGAMIAAARHVATYVGVYRRGETPAAQMGRELRGSTIGIIGFGTVGSYLAPIAQTLGMRVLVYDPYKTPAAPYAGVDLGTLLEVSDFVVPLAIATAETENLIDAAALARMKPTAWLINASRGNLIDETALQESLERKRIAGAAMDVGRAPDQMPSPHLARRPDVIATPHIAGLTLPSIEHQALEVVRQAAAILRGEIPPGAVNAERALRLRQTSARG